MLYTKCSQQLKTQRIHTLQNFTMLIKLSIYESMLARDEMFILQTVHAIKGIHKMEYTDLVTIRMGIYVKSNNHII